MSIVTIAVEGVPVPQGSMKYIGNGRMISDNPKLAAWREKIRCAPVPDLSSKHWPTTRPVAVELTFRMPRPKGHYGTGRNAGTIKARYADAVPAVRPDLDKLCRAVLDAITGGLIKDDGQVVKLSTVKRYATTTEPGMEVTIQAL